MKPKEYLLEATKYRRLAQAISDQIEELRHQMAGIGAIRYDKDHVQTSPVNRMELLMPRLIRMEEKYIRTLARYNAEVLKRTKQIESLDDPRYVELLTLRYIRDLTWEEIAEAMTYEVRHVYRLHGEALQAFGHKHMKGGK